MRTLVPALLLTLATLGCTRLGPGTAPPSPSPAAPESVFTGRLDAIEPSSLKLQVTGQDRSVITDAATAYQQTRMVAAADVRPGMCASVAGTAGPDGLVARFVQVQQPPATGCPRGAGQTPLPSPGAQASVAGRIVSADAAHIELETASGRASVAVAPSTRVSETVNLPRRSLQTGQCLRVTAATPAEGNAIARRVVVLTTASTCGPTRASAPRLP